jgi:diphthine methyl ester acylhydrolase
VVQPSAILDLRFHPLSKDILAVVNSTGMLSSLRFAPGPAGCLTEISRSYPLGGEGSILFTSCCWHPSLSNIIAITTSTHEVHALALTEDWKAKANSGSLVHTHEDNAWTVAFPQKAETSSSEKVFTVLSGGDDSKLLQSTCKYIISGAADTADASGLDGALDGQLGCIENDDPPSNIRGHQAGVTAILPLEVSSAGGESILVTGSYDDHARVYVMRGGMPQLLDKANLGGGVWRLKLIRHEVDGDGGFATVILASCMHAGARILRIQGNPYQSQMQVLARFEEHKSMNYGSDFQPGSGVAGQPLRCISTSFYDKLLCLWDVPYDGEHLA